MKRFKSQIGSSLSLKIPVDNSVSVYAAHRIVIHSPNPGDRITKDYLLRYTISPVLRPKQIIVSYLNINGELGQINSEPNQTNPILIEGMAEGENIIRLTIIDPDGNSYYNKRHVRVDHKLTLITTHQENTAPYITDENKYKNLLKAGNHSASQTNKKISKDDAFINHIVEVLLEEAQRQGIRPDIALAQIILETGWLSFPGDVKENQNNFGGLGATGHGVRGNVFISLQEGIRANMQHLLAYASTRPIKGKLVDPRFYLVDPRGAAAAVEYLGYYENTQGIGWAMDFQYGYKLRDIIEEFDKASARRFKSQLSPVLITEMEVSSIIRQSNPLDIKLIPGFKKGQEVRVAMATNSHTEQRYTVATPAGDIKTLTPWSQNKAIFYLPAEEGLYQFGIEIRSIGSRAVLDTRVKQVQVGGN